MNDRELKKVIKAQDKKHCVLLFSGGQDSMTLYFWAIKQGYNVWAVAFDYKQRHKEELIMAEHFAEDAGLNLKIIDIGNMFEKNSALIDTSLDINAKHIDNDNLPSSFVPLRNAIFLTVASTIAYNRGAEAIITGVNATDYAGYPDCRPEFIESIEKTLSIGLDEEIKILTPLIDKTKAEIWKMAKDLGCIDIIIRCSMTDYNGDKTMNEWGRGKLDNPASIERKKGFDEAKEKGWI